MKEWKERTHKWIIWINEGRIQMKKVKEGMTKPEIKWMYDRNNERRKKEWITERRNEQT